MKTGKVHCWLIALLLGLQLGLIGAELEDEQKGKLNNFI